MEKEAKKQVVQVPVKSKTGIAAKSPVKKPLTYEELMKLAENNTKNTLSVSDLKKDNPQKEEIKKNRPEFVHVPVRKVPLKAKTPQPQIQKKPVKMIKRDMQPRHETSDLVVLNQKKRDLRSIEQIQMELKKEAKKEPKREAKRQENESVSEKDDPEKYYAKNYSSIISNIFGYNREKYANNEEDDDLSDMETDYKTILSEEARSTRLGKQEDLEEELKEIERKKKKAALLMKKSEI